MLVRSQFGRPGDLIGHDPVEIRDSLGLSNEMAARLARLLARGGQLAFGSSG